MEYIKNNYRFELLTSEHDLSSFHCDSDDLNEFLKEDALIQQNYKFNINKIKKLNPERTIALYFDIYRASKG